MPYISCRYAPPPDEGMQQQIICLDDVGREWWLTEDSLVGDYLLFVENGGTIEPVEESP